MAYRHNKSGKYIENKKKNLILNGFQIYTQSSYRSPKQIADVGASISKAQSFRPVNKEGAFTKANHKIFSFGQTTYSTEIGSVANRLLIERGTRDPTIIDAYVKNPE